MGAHNCCSQATVDDSNPPQSSRIDTKRSRPADPLPQLSTSQISVKVNPRRQPEEQKLKDALRSIHESEASGPSIMGGYSIVSQLQFGLVSKYFARDKVTSGSSLFSAVATSALTEECQERLS